MTECNINKILVPVDFSKGSMNALDTAVAMAQKHEAGILLLNVVEPGGLSGIQTDGTAEDPTIGMIHHAEQELQVLQHALIEKFQVSCEYIAATGIVSSVIIKTSVNSEADLIVMGTHGSNGFRESFIGLNAFNVVKNAVCPVLTIPSQKKWESFKKILFPVRAVASALEKYDFLRRIIRKDSVTLKILGLAADYDRDIVVLKDLTEHLNEQLREDEVEASTYFKVGTNMAEEVLKMATLMATDLVVLTATVETSFNQVFVGTYIQHILNHAQFPVLSIKPIHHKNFEKDLIHHSREPVTQAMPIYN